MSKMKTKKYIVLSAQQKTLLTIGLGAIILACILMLSSPFLLSPLSLAIIVLVYSLFSLILLFRNQYTIQYLKLNIVVLLMSLIVLLTRCSGYIMDFFGYKNCVGGLGASSSCAESTLLTSWTIGFILIVPMIITAVIAVYKRFTTQ